MAKQSMLEYMIHARPPQATGGDLCWERRGSRDVPCCEALLAADGGIADLAGGVNFLLDLPPDKRGRIPRDYIDRLMRLRKNAALS